MGQIVSQPINPDYNASLFVVNAASIENTGNDMKPDDKSFWHVNTWDGNSPEWSFAINNTVIQTEPIQGTTMGVVSDPDIVLSMDRNWVRIVYVLDGFLVTSELWQFNGTDYSYISMQFLDEGTNPNIDVNNANHVAVTYQKLGVPHVYAFVEEINNTLAGPTFIYGEGQRPDVAISNFAGVLGQVVVSFTYITPGDQVLVLDQHRYANLLSSSSTPLSTVFYAVDAWQPIQGTLGTPRIAHNWYNTPFSSSSCSATAFDWHRTCAIAVDFVSTTGDEYIYNLTRTLDCPPLPLINDVLGISNLLDDFYIRPNRKPVITYCGDVIVVTWQNDYGTSSPAISQNEIIVWRLNWIGTHWGVNNYSVVNFSNSGDQVIPSVSGRYSSGGATASDCYYLFVDVGANRVMFKGSFYHNINLRAQQTGLNSYDKPVLKENTPEIAVFPNPATDRLNIRGLSENATIEVFDRLGRKLLQQKAAGKQDELMVLENIVPGNYILKIQDEKNEIKHLPLIIE